MCIRDRLGCQYFPKEKQVHIFVEDSGKGIPKAEQKMIFSRFYKQDEFAQGTGLGLSICQVIIGKPVSYTHLDVYKRQGFYPFPTGYNPLILKNRNCIVFLHRNIIATPWKSPLEPNN